MSLKSNGVGISRQRLRPWASHEGQTGALAEPVRRITDISVSRTQRRIPFPIVASTGDVEEPATAGTLISILTHRIGGLAEAISG
jgi:hypothetical protein